jgi:hypothetical protein
MGHQSPHYLKLKGKTYYFSRRVPKTLQKHSNCSRIEICLNTSFESKAIGQPSMLAQELRVTPPQLLAQHFHILQMSMSKLSLKVLLGVFALVPSVSICWASKLV